MMLDKKDLNHLTGKCLTKIEINEDRDELQFHFNNKSDDFQNTCICFQLSSEIKIYKET